MGTAFLTASQYLSPPKMGVYDGVYKLDMTQADPNWAALHKEMGIPEADSKAMMTPGGNVHTMTAASPPAPTTPACLISIQVLPLRPERSRRSTSPSLALSPGITRGRMSLL